MERIRRCLSLLPSWLFSIITLVAILWLTLAPKPLGDNPPPLFPGADKLAHGIMFGGFVAMMLLDWQRKHSWKKVWWQRALFYAIFSALLGILVEFAQANMGLGRGFEYPDMVADTIGAFFIAIFWIYLQKYWVSPRM